MVATHNGRRMAYAGEVVGAVPLGSGSVVGSASAVNIAAAHIAAQLLGDKAPAHEAAPLFESTKERLAGFDGTQLADQMVRTLNEFFSFAEADERCKAAAVGAEAFAKTVGQVFARAAVVAGDEASTVVYMPEMESRPQHAHEPNCAWAIDEAAKEVRLVAQTDIAPGAALTVCYERLSTGLLKEKYGIETMGLNACDGLEVSFDIPPQVYPHLRPHFDKAAKEANRLGRPVPVTMRSDNTTTTHFLSLVDPCPLTLRLCGRARLPPGTSETKLDEFLESLFVSLKMCILKAETEMDSRMAEMDVLVAAISRLSHISTVRAGEPTYKILRSPPTMRGEALAGVPLAKCLSAETARQMPQLANAPLNERQLRVAQAALTRENMQKYAPKLAEVPLLWAEADREAHFKGTSALETLRAVVAQRDDDHAAAAACGLEISKEDWEWGHALVARCSTVVSLPEDVVGLNVANGVAQAVAWQDEDEDTLQFRLEAGPDGTKRFIYSLNGDDRPDVQKIELVDGTTLKFPVIDKEVELVSPSENKEAYVTILSRVRAMAEAAKVPHDIPEEVQFVKPARDVEVVVPAACALPDLHSAQPALHAEQSVWFISSGGGLEVSHRPGSGAAETAAFRGEVALSNPHTAVEVKLQVPCRAMGAEETPEDVHHGMVLQSANLAAQAAEEAGQDAEVTVEMPDLAALQAGAKGLSFGVKFTLSAQRPLPEALLRHFVLSEMPTAAAVENRAEGNELAGVRKVAAKHGNVKAAAAKLLAHLKAEEEARFGAETSLEDDKSKLFELHDKAAASDAVVRCTAESDAAPRAAVGAALRVAERSVFAAARKVAEALAAE